jgi:putative heme-binding domain-containing protein
VPDLAKSTNEQLDAALDSENGVVRDLAHREILARGAPVKPLAPDSKALPEAQIQRAWCAVQRGAPLAAQVDALLANARSPATTAQAISLAEFDPRPQSTTSQRLEALTRGCDVGVAFRLALALGSVDDPNEGIILARLLVEHLADPWVRAAVLTGAPNHAATLLRVLQDLPVDAPGRADAIDGVVATIGGLSETNSQQVSLALQELNRLGGSEVSEPWRWRAIGRTLSAMVRNGESARDRSRSNESSWDRGRMADAARAALVCDPVDPVAAAAALELLYRELPPSPVRTVEPDESTWKVTLRFLSPEHPVELGLAALAAVGRRGDTIAPRMVIDALPLAMPQIRGAALDLLMSRKPWLELVVSSAESGTLPKSCFDASHRDRLLKSDDPALRARAAKLFAPNGTPKRAQVVAQFQSALGLKGDPSAGRVVFEKLCASCHRVRGLGHEVAPDLAAVGDKSPAAYLNSILDPNAAINADSAAYNVELKNGDSLIGLIRGESSTGFTLLQANEVRTPLLRRDVKEVAPSKISLMPENLEEGCAPQDFANLISWLRGGPAPLGSSTDAQCAQARAELRAAKLNGVSRVLASMDVFTQPSWLGPATMHYCRQSDGTASVKWRTFSVAADDLAGRDALAFSFPVAVGFLSQPKGKFTLKLDGKELLEFDVVLDDARFEGAGGATLDYRCRQANGEDSTGVMTLTVPTRLLVAGRPVELEVVGSAANSQRWFGLLLCPEG